MGKKGTRRTWKGKAQDDRLQFYCDDEANRVQTAANLGQACKVRRNNEQNHIVFLEGHCGGHSVLRENCIADNNYFGDMIDCRALSVSYCYIMVLS